MHVDTETDMETVIHKHDGEGGFWKVLKTIMRHYDDRERRKERKNA